MLINAAYGLGENVVQGSVNPDEYCVFKTTLNDGFRPILKKALGTKEFKLVYDVGGSKMTKNVPVPEDDRRRFAITDDDICIGNCCGGSCKWLTSGRQTRRLLVCLGLRAPPCTVGIASQWQDSY